jgi:hypothetical protein
MAVIKAEALRDGCGHIVEFFSCELSDRIVENEATAL